MVNELFAQHKDFLAGFKRFEVYTVYEGRLWMRGVTMGANRGDGATTSVLGIHVDVEYRRFGALFFEAGSRQATRDELTDP